MESGQKTKDLHEYRKKYWILNKEKLTHANRHDPKRKKQLTLGRWKHRGVKYEDYDKLYENYFNTESCEACGIELTNPFMRCLDHDHTTGDVRAVICRGCNNRDGWLKKKKVANNKDARESDKD